MNIQLFISLVTSFTSFLITLRIFVKGYYAALLPMVCLVGYSLLTIDWFISGENKNINQLKDIAWSTVEVGLMLGYSFTLYTMFKDFNSTFKRKCFNFLFKDNQGESKHG